MWFRNKETGAEFYVTNEAHQKRLKADPTYEAFKKATPSKKAAKNTDTGQQPDGGSDSKGEGASKE